MCIAIVKPAGAEVPSYNRIQNSWEANQDGGGFAVQRQGKTLIKYEKGYFDMDKYYNKLVETIKPEDTALIHMRITTHGGTSKECCHPFPISQDYDNMRETHGKCKKIMMHNGILGGAFGQVSKPGVSDTMELVKYLAKANLDTYGEGFQRLMEPILKSSNKVAVLTADGYTLAGKGWIEEDDGCFYSNNTYEDYYSKYCGYNFSFNKSQKSEKKAKHYKKKGLDRGYNKAYNYKKVDVTSLSSQDHDDLLAATCPSCLSFMPDAVYGDQVCKYCNIDYN